MDGTKCPQLFEKEISKMGIQKLRESTPLQKLRVPLQAERHQHVAGVVHLQGIQWLGDSSVGGGGEDQSFVILDRSVPGRHEDTVCQGDFSDRTFVPLKWKYFSNPLHSVFNGTNQIVCFYQPMKLDQSDCLFK